MRKAAILDYDAHILASMHVFKYFAVAMDYLYRLTVRKAETEC